MSGENESLKETAKEQLKSFENLLDEYLRNIGVKELKINTKEIYEVLDMNYEDLIRLDVEQCGAYAFILSRFGLYLQKDINRHNSRVKWAESNLNKLLMKDYKNYGGIYGNDHKIAALCNDNSSANTINSIYFHAKARTIELEGLVNQINLICNTLKDLQFTKRKIYDTTSKN